MTILPNIAIALMAATYFGIGLWVLIAPDHYARLLGLMIEASAGRSEIRVLGGLYTISGGVLFYSLLNPSALKLGLTLLAFVILGTLIARLISLVTGDFSRPEFIYLIFELVYLAIIVWLWPKA